MVPHLQTYTKRIYDAHYRSGYWTKHHLLSEIARSASLHPEKLAIADRDSRISYARLEHLIADVGVFLQDHGIRNGDIVAVQLPNSIHLAVTILALLRIGAVYAPINASYREHEVGRIFQISRPVAYLYPVRFRAADYSGIARKVAEQTRLYFREIPVDLDASVDEAMSPRAEAIALEGDPDPDALFLLGMTSGSTGAPKLFAHTQNTQFSEARSVNKLLGLDRYDIFLVIAPMTHRGALMYGLLMSMACGGSLVIQRENNAEETLRLIERERISTFFAIPTQVLDLLQLVRKTGDTCKSLRLLMLSGAPVQPELITDLKRSWPDCVPVTSYGTSEIGFSTATRPDDPLETLQTCGRTVPGQEVKVVHREGLDAGDGEILVRGAFVFCGYYADQYQTNLAMSDDWFKTGDVGHIDPDGYLHVTGRIKNTIIRGGLNVQAEEIETILMAHPDVLEVLVIGMPDPRLGERVAACVVPKPGTTFDVTDLRAHFELNAVAKFKWPEQLAIMDTIPRNPVGKQDRIALRERAPSMRFVSVREPS
jgi:cyclohexanecarboxylate-CoA ligase